MRMLKCSLSAAVAAFLLVFLATDLAVFAQRDYKGMLFWMAPPAAYSGALWISPPIRSWEDDWGVASSFPQRVWEYEVGGAPPNDPCERLPYITDAEIGPFGLQINQYTGEWWEGTTYVGTPGDPHTGPPPGFDPDLFGFFSFGDRSDRPGVDSRGIPGGLGGNPGACVAKAITVLRGGGAQWKPNDQRDGDCLSSPSFTRLRMNVELRCEADLRDRDEYTEAFWAAFDVVLPTILPDGFTEAPVVFPADYPNGPSVPGASPRSFPGRVWLRRIDFNNEGVSWSDGDEPLSSVFNIATASPWGATTGVDPDLARPEMYQWQLEGTAAERRASSRNPFVEIDGTGTIVNHERMIINDLIKGVDDCVSLDLFSSETSSDGSPMPCGRMNAAGTAFFSKDPDGMPTDLGPNTPRELAAELGAPMLPGARGNHQPFPVGGDLFWSEQKAYGSRCTAGYVVIDDLPLHALEARDFYYELFLEAWQAYEDALAGGVPSFPYEDSEALDILDAAVSLMSTVVGWDTIYRYRFVTQPLMEDAFYGAGYVPAAQMGVDSLAFHFQGAPAGECELPSLTVQPIRGYTNSGGYGSAPAGGLPTGHLVNIWDSNLELFSPGQPRPHFYPPVIQHTHGPIGHAVRDSVPSGTVFPEAASHWRGPDSDITFSNVMNVAFACGSVNGRLYAPDVEQLSIFPHWAGPPGARFWTGEQDVRYPGGVRTVDPPSVGLDPAHIGAFSGCTDARLGAPDDDCFKSPVLAEDVAAYDSRRGGVNGRTLTSRALDAHVAAGTGTGASYQFQEVADLNDAIFLDAGLRGDYARTSSGDVNADGERDVYAKASSAETISYTVTLVDSLLEIQGGLVRAPFSEGSVYGGFADWDHQVGGASSGNRLQVQQHYWGVSPGTMEYAPLGTVAQADEETMTTAGPIRFSGSMDLARNGGVVGSCTLCSEKGCDDSVVEEFVNERFTSSVTQGTQVCLIERGLTPPNDCPGP